MSIRRVRFVAFVEKGEEGEEWEPCICKECTTLVGLPYYQKAETFDVYKTMGLPLEYGKTQIGMATFIKASEIMAEMGRKVNTARPLEELCTECVTDTVDLTQLDKLGLPNLVIDRTMSHTRGLEVWGDMRRHLSWNTAMVPALLLKHQGMYMIEKIY